MADLKYTILLLMAERANNEGGWIMNPETGVEPQTGFVVDVGRGVYCSKVLTPELIHAYLQIYWTDGCMPPSMYVSARKDAPGCLLSLVFVTKTRQAAIDLTRHHGGATYYDLTTRQEVAA